MEHRDPIPPNDGGEPTDHTRILQAVSGLIWTLVFAALAIIAGGLFDWLLIDLFPESTFSRQVLSQTCGVLLASWALPRPSGIPRRSGIGLAITPNTKVMALFGLALGIELAALSVGLPWLTGALTFEIHAADAGVWALGNLPGVPSAIGVLIVGAFGEELLVRGYGFQQLSRAITPLGAVIATGILFGALHAGNPSAAWLSIVNTALFGVLFGLAVVRYRSLWPAIAMHLGWNFTLAILGAPISGLRMGVTALRATPVGSELWTGGSYGPEASLLTTVAVFTAALVVWKMPIPTDTSPLIWDDVRPSQGGSKNS